MPENHFYRRSAPILQPNAVFDQAAPGSDWYMVLNASNVRILNVKVRVTWTVQPSLDLDITIVDGLTGITYVFTLSNPVSGTDYFPQINFALANDSQVLGTTNNEPVKPFIIDVKSIRIFARRTGGTVSNLHCEVKYQKF